MAAANTKFAMVLLRALAVIGYRARGLNWSRSSRWCLVVNLICERALAGMLEQYRIESDFELQEKQRRCGPIVAYVHTVVSRCGLSRV